MPISRRRYLERCCRAGVAVGGVSMSGCLGNGSESSPQTTVRVGSKPFTEQKVLGYLAYERLQALDSISVVNEVGAGSSLTHWRAAQESDDYLYWEYTGTAWLELPPRHENRITSPERLYNRVEKDAADLGLHMLEPAPFSNEFVVVVNADWAHDQGFDTLSALFEAVSRRPTEIGFAVNEEFYNRTDGWCALLGHYGVDSHTQRTLESDGFVVTSVGLTYELLDREEYHVATGFATDPQLQQARYTTLTDDQEYFVPYQPAPTLARALAERHPEIVEALQPLVEALDEETVRSLNGAVDRSRRHPSDVASEFLDKRDIDNG